MAYRSNISGPGVHHVAEVILNILFDLTEVKGGKVQGHGNWRPASVVLAHMVYPNETIVTNLKGDTHHDTDGYNRYWQVLAAVALLEEQGMVSTYKEGSGHFYRITLKEENNEG